MVQTNRWAVTAIQAALSSVSYTHLVEGTLEDEKGFCAVVTTQDIAKQDYILTPGRYVGICLLYTSRCV